jgi:hypothetical protein
MKLPRFLVAAINGALLLPGLAAALPPCAMNGGEPAVAAGEHDCCPPEAAELDRPCCERSHAAPAVPPSSERLDAHALAPSATTVTTVGSHLASRAAVFDPSALPPIDRLAQGCILRI